LDIAAPVLVDTEGDKEPMHVWSQPVKKHNQIQRAWNMSRQRNMNMNACRQKGNKDTEPMPAECINGQHG